MENKINYKDVPACFTHCIQADCQMANHCLRQLAMQALPDSERAVRIFRLQGKFGRNPYFERRKGERLCSPSEVKEVEAALKAIGHEELKFDAYVKKLNWID